MMISSSIGKVSGISAEYWLGLQSAYDLKLARGLQHA